MAWDRLAVVAYESPFAPCGGVAAVMKHLPGALAAEAGGRVAVFTPLHYRMLQAPRPADLLLAAVYSVPLGTRQVTVNLRHLAQDPIDWYFVGTDQIELFAGAPDPYGVGANLTRDALFFGAAVARGLWMLDPRAAWGLHVIDWQAATTALALASGGQIWPHRVQLALHNSYDAPLRYYDLHQVGISPHDCPPAGSPETSTVLLRALPLVAPTVCTVSQQFAHDLVSEPLHTHLLAAHLQPHLPGRLRGVDDGCFVAPSVPAEITSAKPAAAPARLLAWKRERWVQAVEALTTLPGQEHEPVWGDRVAFAQAAASGALAPLLMGGRDDSQQKGYDLAAAAIDRLLAADCPAQFILLPMPGGEGLAGLGYLRELAARWPSRVLALPFRFRGYADLLAGTAYGLMPSLYEPFGSANEFYLAGTAVIARATGGLVQQVVPMPLASGWAVGVERLARAWHQPAAVPTGYLFREDEGLSAQPEAWWRLRGSRYGGPDGREHQPLFGSMVDAFVDVTQAAVTRWRDEPEAYATMVLAGLQHVRDGFTWQRAAREYLAAL
mgnify:CR=1 FL=1